MDVFTDITSNPDFAMGVTELVYDARLFWEFWTQAEKHRLVYDAALQSHDPSVWKLWGYAKNAAVRELVRDWAEDLNWPSNFNETIEEADKSRARYIVNFDQQNRILDAGEDFEVLCQGLRQLPNLRTITICSSFDDENPNSADLHGQGSGWYEARSRDLWKDTLTPSHWALCRQMRSEAADHDNEELETALDDFPWDWRGLINCMHAIGLQKPWMTHLPFGTHKSKLPFDLMGDSHVASCLLSLAPTLECLKLDCLIDDGTFEELHLSRNTDPVSTLGNVL